MTLYSVLDSGDWFDSLQVHVNPAPVLVAITVTLHMLDVKHTVPPQY
jgi:hypothetical protein